MARRWTNEEQEYLRTELTKGAAVGSIARVLDRSFDTVRKRAESLRRIEKGMALQAAKVEGRSLDKLVEDIHVWQTETFVDGTEEGRIEHWKEEIAEYLKDPSNGEEAADVFLLFVAILKNRGVDLRAEAERKLEINKKRQWAKAAGGYSKHVA